MPTVILAILGAAGAGKLPPVEKGISFTNILPIRTYTNNVGAFAMRETAATEYYDMIFKARADYTALVFTMYLTMDIAGPINFQFNYYISHHGLATASWNVWNIHNNTPSGVVVINRRVITTFNIPLGDIVNGEEIKMAFTNVTAVNGLSNMAWEWSWAP